MNGFKMTLSEVAVAIGLLTPLVLGILAFIEKFVNRKTANEPEAPPVVQGMTVATDSYVDRLIHELTEDKRTAEAGWTQAKQENNVLRAQLEAYRERDRP